jgi:hypothetical protein
LPTTGEPRSPRREEQPPSPTEQQPQPKNEETPPPRTEQQPQPNKAESPPPSKEQEAQPRGEQPSQPQQEKPKPDDPPKAIPGQAKNGDDLPDVSLQIPEETRPEVKAILKANASALSSRQSSERVKAAEVLGELGEQGKPARGPLCRAMLDRVRAVCEAAADALKKIDPKMQYLAVTLLAEKDPFRLMSLLREIQKLEDDGEPLAPLVAHGVKVSAVNNVPGLLALELETLSHIGRNDLPSFKLVLAALSNQDAQIRVIALQGLARMKHGKLAVRKILTLLKTDIPGIRVAAIKVLTVLADESTEEIIAAAIAAQRYHEAEIVRQAVEVALNKLENGQKP